MGTPKRMHPTAVRPGTLNEAAEAYARIEPAIMALPQKDVGRVTTDVPSATSLALGALPQLEALLPEMNDVFKKPPKAQIERLRDHALGLLYAHIAWLPRSSNALDGELEEARALREQLLASADAHVSYGQMDAAAVAAIRQGAGHLDRANDLIALVGLFHAAWPVISKKTQATPEQLDRAAALGPQLVAALGANTLGAGSVKDGKTAADRRNRAFRVFLTDYEEIRAAVQYVRRHEGDADAFAPSLHPRTRGVKETEVVSEPGTDPTDTEA